MVYIILLMSLPLLGWTILGIIPNKYLNQMIDGKKPSKEPEAQNVQSEDLLLAKEITEGNSSEKSSKSFSKTSPDTSLDHWAKIAAEKNK